MEVAWNLKAWHGGGYTYRLAPADEPLTEANFQKMPLKFLGKKPVAVFEISQNCLILLN